MGKAARDSSCHLLRTCPTLPDVFVTKQYIFFISSATDVAPVNGNKAQAGKRDLFCYSFSSQLQLVTNHRGIRVIPVAAADGAPRAMGVHFHGAFKRAFATAKSY